jgi:hypothetical protein
LFNYRLFAITLKILMSGIWKFGIAVLLVRLFSIFALCAQVDFEQDILPVLEAKCLDCHGEKKQKGNFRLDRLYSMLMGGDTGEPAVVPGDPAASFLMQAIKHEAEDFEMPPKGGKLPDAQIALFENWIREGARVPERWGPAKKSALEHWSFLPVQRIDIPGGIDSFIQKKLSGAGLEMSPEADRRTLIRRLYLVMLGLPPCPEEVDAFVGDKSPDAWGKLVDKVLASPHYGERWATHWLDLARFGETHGFEMNRERPTAWPYRDWVIAAFNDDKPYDEFVREQIAGDCLGEDIGTAFLVAGPVDQVKGRDPKLRQMQRMNELDDMINTVGATFLGLTTGCARCHGHKFDPITQTDYYAMQAVFAGVQHGNRNLPPTPESLEEIQALDKRIAGLKEKLQAFVPKSTGASLAIDDESTEHLVEKRGHGNVAGGAKPDLSGGKYTWWTNKPGQKVAAYHPNVSGTYRIWLSWGAGYETHTRDARYLLGGKEIAKVNQQLMADGSGKVVSKPLWSGLYDAGVHEIRPGDSLVLASGETGTALTADIVFFRAVNDSEPVAKPGLRPAVSATHNVEAFSPVLTKSVRFTITKANQGQPCIDELEIFSNGRNVALASMGAKATSSGDFVHPKHKLEHINDGQYGNSRSWIAAKPSGWVQIDFPSPIEVDRIEWARDREGQYQDRLAQEYKIEAAVDGGTWKIVASSSDRLPVGEGKPAQEYVFTGKDAEKGKAWKRELKDLETRRNSLSQNQVYAGNFTQPGPTHRLFRGEPDIKREEVGPGGIQVFVDLGLPVNSPEKERRLALANWIANPENPLTARVMANRIWQHHFGRGIVDTPSDFGHNGVPPTHPELLDWLASEFVSSGWSIKHIQKLILMSATWRQSNLPAEMAMDVDAASSMLWRFPPRRLEAEAIRDSILAASGVLNMEKPGGPGFSPFQVEMENVRHYHPKETYGPEDWRRMVYMTKVRQEREQVFGAFDCPDASQAVAKRSRSTTPLQALNLLNSSFVLQQAGIFAQRIKTESSNPEGQVQLAWGLCFGRLPTEEETLASVSFIKASGLVQFARAMLNSNEFVFIP